MGFINVFVASGCAISIHNNTLLLSGERERSYPLQDINSIMLESRECTITSYALGEIAKANIALYACDECHMPVGVFTPYNTYCRQLEMWNALGSVTRPTLKKLWQSIVRQKIYNEAICLDLMNIDGAELLESIAAGVYSGDSGNGEAHAAQVYFCRLFGADFSRRQDTVLNGALNYTYAIVRGIIARSLVVYGFLPFVGIHHRSVLNSYNLADDLIEPFRAICDYYVLNVTRDEWELTPEVKGRLYSIVNVEVSIEGEKHSLSNAIDKMIVSLKDIVNGSTAELSMPTLIGASIHRYE